MGRPATGRTTGTLGVRLSHAELTELQRRAANLSLYVTQDGTIPGLPLRHLPAGPGTAGG